MNDTEVEWRCALRLTSKEHFMKNEKRKKWKATDTHSTNLTCSKNVFSFHSLSPFAPTHKHTDRQTDRHKCQTMKNKTYKHASSKICAIAQIIPISSALTLFTLILIISVVCECVFVCFLGAIPPWKWVRLRCRLRFPCVHSSLCASSF